MNNYLTEAQFLSTTRNGCYDINELYGHHQGTFNLLVFRKRKTLLGGSPIVVENMLFVIIRSHRTRQIDLNIDSLSMGN